MTLKYTSVNNIKLRLKGRLAVPSLIGASAIVGQQEVDPALIEAIALQQEEFMDSYLGMLYEMPLKHAHPILSGIVEKLVISEIMVTYYQQGFSPDQGSDAGYGSVLRKQALDSMQMLFVGTKILVPGTQPLTNASNVPGGESIQYRFVPLPNETLKKFIGVDQDGDGIPDDLRMLTALKTQKASGTFVYQRRYNQNTNKPINWHETGRFDEPTRMN